MNNHISIPLDILSIITSFLNPLEIIFSLDRVSIIFHQMVNRLNYWEMICKQRGWMISSAFNSYRSLFSSRIKENCKICKFQAPKKKSMMKLCDSCTRKHLFSQSVLMDQYLLTDRDLLHIPRQHGLYLKKDITEYLDKRVNMNESSSFMNKNELEEKKRQVFTKLSQFGLKYEKLNGLSKYLCYQYVYYHQKIGFIMGKIFESEK